MSRQFGAVMHWIRRVAASGPCGATSDGHLLERFIAHQDEAAFAELVGRHGPMVLAVCRRLLSNLHDAEDAFQATFLVLVRKATSIAKRESVGSWLHGVAHRVAAKARAQHYQRSGRESEIVDMRAVEPSAEILWQEVRAVLDEEVGRLPEKYRAPFVLCYLEGKTNEETAQHLCCPKGTVATRLAWAREVLRKRLSHRGVTLSAGLLVTLLMEKALPAAVPGALAGATIETALLAAAGKTAAAGMISAKVTSLVEFGVKAVAVSKAKIALTVCLAVTTIAMGAGVFRYQTGQKQTPQDEKPAASEQKPASQQFASDKAVITGTVVDAEDRPLSDVDVRAYGAGERLEITLRSNDRGQIQVPREWDNRDHHYTLIAQLGDRLGCYALPDYSAANQGKPVTAFRIRVLPRTKTIQGTLVDMKGRPLSKVLVIVHGLNEARFYVHTAESPLGKAVTDTQGRFSLKVPEYSYCELIPADPGLIRKRINAKPNQPDLGRVMVAEAGTISGRVTDVRTGRPIVGASIGAQFLGTDFETGGYGPAQTDKQGRYTIPSLRPGLHNVLFNGAFQRERLTAPAQEAVRVDAGKTASADFRAVEGRLLSGKVVGLDDNKPIADCHVGYHGAARPRSGAAVMMVRTDAQGSFRFYVPPGNAYVYVAETRGPITPDSSQTLEVPADKDPDPVQLDSYSVVQKHLIGESFLSTAESTETQQDHSYKLMIRFRSKNGKPVVGANIWLWRKGATTWTQWSGAAGEEREIPIGSSGEGQTYFLIIEAPGWARPKPPEFVAAKVMKPLVIDMEPATYVPVRGRVLDSDGKPVTKALVRAGLVLSNEGTQFPWGVEPLTDNDGRFELKHLRPQDQFNLQLNKKGLVTLTSRFFVLKPGPALELGTFRLLAPGQSAEAVVGKPAPEFAVRTWIGKRPANEFGYSSRDFQGKVVLLAFLDEARPSERLLKQLDSLHRKLADQGLVITRVYEGDLETELSKASPTLAAVAAPGLLSEGTSLAAEKYGVKARPTLFLIDRQGILCGADVEADRIQEQIEGILKR